MPIARFDGKLIYYAHVPKCAGSSVEAYLHERFGPLAFVDTQHARRRSTKSWTATSPQHVHVKALAQLFPESFFDHAFTVVRHPVDRIVSAYHFQREIERTVPQAISFSEWLTALPDELEERPFAYDNHVRPMVELVPEGAKVFYLEHGLDAIIPWFDELCGSASGPRSIPHVNERKPSKELMVEPTATERGLIAEIYAADFDRFGYSLNTKAPLEPTSLATGTTAHRDDEVVRRRPVLSRIQSRIHRLIRS